MNLIAFFGIFILGLGILLIIIGIKYINKAKNMIDVKEQNLQKEKEEKRQLQSEISILLQNKTELIESINANRKRNEEEYENSKKIISEQINFYRENAQNASVAYIENLEKEYTKAEQKYLQRKKELEDKQKQIEKDIEDAGSRYMALKSKINAATEAQLREREKEEKLDFYKLSISSIDLDDIQKLESIKLMLHNPIILSKLIWSTYFQKQTTEMCNRILGLNKICGIYKITNIKTKQCYIGQSVDVAQRWKDHCKCGCGIEASKTNKLYNAMQKDGIWSFTFELLEECPREQLNEAEKRWIEIYKASELGYNSTVGNK